MPSHSPTNKGRYVRHASDEGVFGHIDDANRSLLNAEQSIKRLQDIDLSLAIDKLRADLRSLRLAIAKHKEDE